MRDIGSGLELRGEGICETVEGGWYAEREGVKSGENIYVIGCDMYHSTGKGVWDMPWMIGMIWMDG